MVLKITNSLPPHTGMRTRSLWSQWKRKPPKPKRHGRKTKTFLPTSKSEIPNGNRKPSIYQMEMLSFPWGFLESKCLLYRLFLRYYLKRLRSSVASHSYSCHARRWDARRQLAPGRAMWRDIERHVCGHARASCERWAPKNFLPFNSGTVHTYLANLTEWVGYKHFKGTIIIITILIRTPR